MKIFMIVLIISTLFCNEVLSKGKWELPFDRFQKYGVPAGENPSYQDRAISVFTQMVRMAPRQWRDKYMLPRMRKGDRSGRNTFDTNKFPATNPLYFNLNLARAARAHSYDRGQNCLYDQQAGGSQHNSCNTTTFASRIRNFYTSGGAGENYIQFAIVRSQEKFGWSCGGKFHNDNRKFWPLWTIASWICEGAVSCNGLQSCASDTEVGRIGHRSNMMDAANKEIGVGTKWTDQDKPCTTQNIGTGLSGYGQPKIVDGAHIWDDVGNKSKIKYMANVFAPGAKIERMEVIVEGKRIAMNLNGMGIATRGTYSTAEVPFEDGQCFSYYFVLTFDGNQVERFPAEGSFKLYDFSGCMENWVSTSKDPSNAAPLSQSLVNTKIVETTKEAPKNPAFDFSNNVPSLIRPIGESDIPDDPSSQNIRVILLLKGDMASFNAKAFIRWLATLLNSSEESFIFRSAVAGSVRVTVDLKSDEKKSAREKANGLEALVGTDDPSVKQGEFAVIGVKVSKEDDVQPEEEQVIQDEEDEETNSSRQKWHKTPLGIAVICGLVLLAVVFVVLVVVFLLLTVFKKNKRISFAEDSYQHDNKKRDKSMSILGDWDNFDNITPTKRNKEQYIPMYDF